ncbi:MazG family protein [Saxibacter everestensis]|uniref:MazG family protein n=1 Tax=Saxibacter everestensis TaxID=2909229 RepID=A0ABY8QQQ8_9MICO|nr:MazG family protein [Brevibacteriaceae bacterium ZFBP1038]
MRDKSGTSFMDLVGTMDRLRSPGGCPWDREQTHISLLPYLIEESYELVEAVESGDREHIVEELGDVLLQVIFHARVGQDAQDAFDIDDVIAAISAKLRRRHPHVFERQPGGPEVTTAALENGWEALKQAEKPERESVFDGIPQALPAVSRAQKILRKAQRTQLDSNPGSGTTEGTASRGERMLAIIAEAEAAGADAESELRETIRIEEARLRVREYDARQRGHQPGGIHQGSDA